MKNKIHIFQDWSNFYQDRNSATATCPFLRKHLPVLGEGETAHVLDLGAGKLAESRYMLQSNYHVVAVDNSIEFGLTPECQEYSSNLELVKVAFWDYQYPENHFDVVHARNSLPFCDPAEFKSVFEGIRRSLKKNGIFIGTFFSNYLSELDSRSSYLTLLEENDIRILFNSYSIQAFEGDNLPGQPFFDSSAWTTYYVLASKL